MRANRSPDRSPLSIARLGGRVALVTSLALAGALAACSNDRVTAPQADLSSGGAFGGVRFSKEEDAAAKAARDSAAAESKAQKEAQEAAEKEAKEAAEAAKKAKKAADEAAAKAAKALEEAAKSADKAVKEAAEQAAREAKAAQDAAERAAKEARAAAEKASKTLKGLARLTKIDKKEVKAVIGAEGGVIELPWAGLTVTVPRGALLLPVEIRVKPADDKTVAYEFQPHGLQFLRPLQFKQSLDNTEWATRNGNAYGLLRGGYFADIAQLIPGVGGVVDETMQARMLDANHVTLQIWHFSGYMMSTGKVQRDESNPEF